MMEWNAYHFVGPTLRDGQPVPDNGVTLKYEGEIKLCESGYHASKDVWDAFNYAPGNTLCRVYCGGDILSGGDKLVCSERTIISRIDCEELFIDFARQCALDVIDNWDCPSIVKEYLTTGKEDIRDAAWSAAWSADRSAVRIAARYAAWYAARSAAWSASRSAAWYADRSADRSAARYNQKQLFTKMVEEKFYEQANT